MLHASNTVYKGTVPIRWTTFLVAYKITYVFNVHYKVRSLYFFLNICYLLPVISRLLTNTVSPVRACLIIWLERFRGSQNEDDRGPFSIQSSLGWGTQIIRQHRNSGTLFTILSLRFISLLSLRFISLSYDENSCSCGQRTDTPKKFANSQFAN
jgi:hypothetical protein